MRPFRWWAEHPWVGWWGTLVLLVFVPAYPPSIRLAAAWIAAVVWYLSFVQGLRVTGRRNVVKAALIAGAVAGPDAMPAMAAGGVRLLEYALGIGFPREPVPPALRLFAYVAGGAILTECSVRVIRGPGEGPASESPGTEVQLAPWGEPMRRGAPARLARNLGVVALALFLLPASMVVKVGWAKRQAEAVCAEAVVGGPVEGLEAKARARGLIVWSSPAGTVLGRPQPASIMAWEGFVFARWFCTIEHADGKVLSKRMWFLD